MPEAMNLESRELESAPESHPTDGMTECEPESPVAGTIRARHAPLATEGQRFGAVLINVMVYYLSYRLIVGTFSERVGMPLLIVWIVGLEILNCYMLSTRGQSVGKMAMKIKIVQFEGEKQPGFVEAVLLRSWVPSIIYAVPVVGLVFGLVDAFSIMRKDRRCVHDMMAGTQVIRVPKS